MIKVEIFIHGNEWTIVGPDGTQQVTMNSVWNSDDIFDSKIAVGSLTEEGHEKKEEES